MLLQFAVTNFRSFRDPAVLSLVPAPGVAHRPGQTVETGLSEIPRVLRAAVVYGANGAGKSNLVYALRNLVWAVIAGRASTVPSTGITPFRLADSGTVSRFEVELALGGARFSYGVEFDRGSVAGEWLERSAAGVVTTVFERDPADPSWSTQLGFDAADLPAAVALARNLPAERLFLTGAAEAGLAPCRAVHDWFAHHVSDESMAPMDQFGLFERPEARAHLLRLLQDAGAGVDAVRLAYDFDDPSARDQLRLAGLEGGRPYEPTELLEGLRKAGITAPRLAPRFARRRSDGALSDFAPDEESEGTRRLVDHLAWQVALHTEQRLTLIDEVERSLHPLVVRRLLEPVFREDTRGQLVCTTHDSWLLDLNLMPADSVWFAEKDPSGATRLYSLAEFEPSQLAALSDDLERGYLNGRFGAIPFVGDAHRMGWSR